MNDEKNIYESLLKRNRCAFLRNYLEINKNDIKQALKDKVKNKDIYNYFKETTGINIKYVWFSKVLSEFKIKYVYSVTPKENNTSQPETESEPKTARERFRERLLAAKLETQVENFNESESEPKKLSNREKLLAIKNRPDEEKIIDIQKNQEKFIWKPSIKKQP